MDKWNDDMKAALGEGLVDIWLKSGVRWCNCYYDHITNQWRAITRNYKMVWVHADAVTHWRRPPEGP